MNKKKFFISLLCRSNRMRDNIFDVVSSTQTLKYISDEDAELFVSTRVLKVNVVFVTYLFYVTTLDFCHISFAVGMFFLVSGKTLSTLARSYKPPPSPVLWLYHEPFSRLTDISGLTFVQSLKSWSFPVKFVKSGCCLMNCHSS